MSDLLPATPGDPLRLALRPVELGEDLRLLPLVIRNQMLGALRRLDHPYVRDSEPIKNGERLLAESRARGLSIVSKRKHAPHKSGKCD